MDDLETLDNSGPTKTLRELLEEGRLETGGIAQLAREALSRDCPLQLAGLNYDMPPERRARSSGARKLTQSSGTF